MNNKLSIQDLASILASQTGKSEEDSERFLHELISVIIQGAFDDNMVKIKGIGSFKIIKVEERASVSVNTGERFVIPSHYKMTFAADKNLRDLVNKPFSLFETTELNEEALPLIQEVDLSRETLNPQAVEPDQKPIKVESSEEKVEEEAVVPVANEISDEKISEEVVPSDGTLKEEEVKSASIVEDVPEEVKVGTPDSTEKEVVPKVKETPSSTRVHHSSHHGNSLRHNKSRKSLCSNPVFLLACFALVVVIGIVYVVGLSDRNTVNKVLTSEEVNTTVSAAVTAVPLEEKPIVQKSLKSDSATKVIPADSVNAALSVEQQQQTESKLQNTADSKVVEKTQKDVIDLVTVRPGDLLSKYAKHYYGHKFFWVYIYMYNKDAIANPNNVPIGTKLKIPAAHLYDIDASSKASISKAAELQAKFQTLGK